MPVIRVIEPKLELTVPEGTALLDALKAAGAAPDAPCGGHGTCGKCRVTVNGREALACRTRVEADMVVALPQGSALQAVSDGLCIQSPRKLPGKGCALAIDIGTTSLVCCLLDGRTGEVLAQKGMKNPQAAYGADVVSRIRAALAGEEEALTRCVREALTALTQSVCAEAGVSPEEILLVAPVGNPAMQQLFLGICPENLAKVPFAPVLTEAKTVPCGEILPVCPNARLQIVPDVSGYVGADTVACVLATGLHRKEEVTLLVDIGTNGEMVLGSKERMIACATAAGPALEGANIRFGMRAENGAIDRVWVENGVIRCSVLGGGAARGICGSGIIDAVAAGLKLGILDSRGRICNSEGILRLTEQVYLTQEDIRQAQLAKGAVCAGVELMTQALGLELADIQQVQLAGAFGSFLNPESACRIGLLPESLLGRIRAVGNAAASGARLLALDEQALKEAGALTRRIEFLELASLRAFPRTFAKAMRFREEGL